MNEEKLTKINNKLKVYLNEAGFISMKCRNKVLKIFSEVFLVDLDISNYKNVDLKIQDDYSVLYRDDIYKTNINSYEELEGKYNNFSEKAEQLIKKKDINFKNKSNKNNIINLIILFVLITIDILVGLLVVRSFLTGDYYNCLWFMVFVIPVVFPRMKDAIQSRFVQARNYLKSFLKK